MKRKTNLVHFTYYSRVESYGIKIINYFRIKHKQTKSLEHRIRMVNHRDSGLKERSMARRVKIVSLKYKPEAFPLSDIAK